MSDALAHSSYQACAQTRCESALALRPPSPATTERPRGPSNEIRWKNVDAGAQIRPGGMEEVEPGSSGDNRFPEFTDSTIFLTVFAPGSDDHAAPCASDP